MPREFTDTCDTVFFMVFWDDHVVYHPKIDSSQVEGILYGIIYEVREV